MLFFSLTSHERQLLEEFIAHPVLSNEARRAQALLWLDAGESPQSVAARLHASRQTVYNWATRFKRRRTSDINVRLADGKRSGRPSTLSSRLDPILEKVLDQSPRQLGYGADQWTISLLSRHLEKAYSLTTNRTSLSGSLQRLGKSLRSARFFVDEFELDGVTG